jgi:hypothetical protein
VSLFQAIPNALKVKSAPSKGAEKKVQEFFLAIAQAILVEIEKVFLISSCRHLGPGHCLGQRIRDETIVESRSSHLTGVISLWMMDSQLTVVK